MRILFGLILCASVVGGISGVVFSEELFADFLFVLGAAFYVLLPLGVILFVAAVIQALRKKKALGPRQAALIWCIPFCGLIAFWGTASGINRYRVRAVEAYVAKAVPVLDDIKKQTGVYPATLPVSSLGQPPYLLHTYGDYSSNGGADFRFEYIDEPAGWAGGEGLLQFTSSTREWSPER